MISIPSLIALVNLMHYHMFHSSLLIDSELSAKELQCKYWKEKDGLVLYEDDGSPKKKGSKPLEIDSSLFGGLDFA